MLRQTIMSNLTSGKGSTPCDVNSLLKKTPTVIGLYGISGSGKTFCLEALRTILDPTEYLFFEGAEVIAALGPGGLTTFQALHEGEKKRLRHIAITKIRDEALQQDKIAIVTGHLMLWQDEKADGRMIYTQADLDCFSHIIYLKIPAETIASQRREDTQRHRRPLPVEQLQDWQQREESELRHLCPLHKIIFLSLPSLDIHLLLKLFDSINSKETERQRVERLLKPHLKDKEPFTGSALIIDGDRTLAAEDTGALFWEIAAKRGHKPSSSICPLKTLFSGPLGYTDLAFFQAMLMYQEVASAVTIHEDFVKLLNRAKLGVETGRTCAVVMTCGLEKVWRMVLDKAEMDHVLVIGSGRISDSASCVTPKLKEAAVIALRSVWECDTWVFGDSILDLPMLMKAHHPIVVVGEEESRSKTMDAALLDAIENKGLQAQQVLLPDHVTPRLTIKKLPVTTLRDQELLGSIYWDKHPASDMSSQAPPAAQLLTTLTLDARVAGPALRDAHRRIGWYMAMSELSGYIGVEEYAIPHVQGFETKGHRLLNGEKTCIVAMMRGGEPMASGVHDAFPLASFFHAKDPHDLDRCDIKAYKNIILVDSVVNTGKSLISFIKKLGYIWPDSQLFVLAGVVQQESIRTGSQLADILSEYRVELVALRLSDNKYTGQGGTDTGNRLFNTTW